ncbi:hypothetical protein HPP92_017118 [Vanilla planifolia]|uniref:7-dehydrocholesterol reductase n=1 Tax=Vanilla planifolia TaxID=51239 RepID=A0A835QKN2_VANPL|nr:hypothetical protein HPP92_017118 [Vanilla planifolia]
MMSWAVLAFDLLHQTGKLGALLLLFWSMYEQNKQVADSMLVYTILTLAYVTNSSYGNQDIGALWILLMIELDSTSAGDACLVVSILLAGLVCIYINYDCDRQRQVFRKTNGRCLIWGNSIKGLKHIEATYFTTKGESKTNLLLTSGWWGLSRHFHYVPEILAAFFWTVPALFNHFLPYFYVIFLTILLLDRAKRDDDRCSSKYGKYWKLYCTDVRYRVLPRVY